MNTAKPPRNFAQTYNLWLSRSGVYYFRAVLPRWAIEAQPHLPKEIRRSLDTTSEREAMQLVKSFQVAYEQVLERVRETMPKKPKRPQQLQHNYITMMNVAYGGVTAGEIKIDTGNDDKDKQIALDMLSSMQGQPPATVSAPAIPAEKESALLSEIASKYVSDCRDRLQLAEKTIAEYKAILELFVRIVGDRPAAAFAVEDMDKYVTTLRRLPSNLNKRYPGHSIAQVLAKKPTETMHTTTINKSVTRVSQLLNWAKTRKMVSDNVAIGQQLASSSTPHEQVDIFESAELVRIAEELCKDHVDKPFKFWSPLLALFSGARQQELAQLYVKDIEESDGIWCFNIIKRDDEPDKKLKNLSARRTIPIHATLIELGFLDFVKAQKAKKHTRIFPEISRGQHGYGDKVSKWFLDTFLPKTLIRTGDDKKVFHSFRHCFINQLKQQRRSNLEIGQVVGHQDESVTSGRYGKPFSDKEMKVMVDGVLFELPMATLATKRKQFT